MCWSILITALLLMGMHEKVMGDMDYDHMELDADGQLHAEMERMSPYVYAGIQDSSNIRETKRLPLPSRFPVYRRVCIPRSGLCDNHPHDCCFNSSCRCNLWGNNCRCQRMGLFQKWG